MAKLVSKTYGDALFELALEEKKVDLLFDEAKVFLEVIQKDDELIRFMKHPKIVKEEKMKTGKNIFDKNFSKEFAGFLLILVQKDRFEDVEKILEYFIGRIKEYKKIGVAYVSTAIALNDAQKKKVEKRLLETTAYETFEMNYTVDETLLGGMVIRVGDRVVDTSIKNKLRELSKQLSAIHVG
ncbi:MAG: ATP synthase F1 subunit delta [Lachnospiraceae bacterium]|nr:ATP synthase F1 subunit delta [Lachnospiraceae bacterium]